MNANSILLFLLIGQISAVPSESTSVQAIPQSNEGQTKAMKSVTIESSNWTLTAYNQTSDIVISWPIYQDLIDTLEMNRGKYSAATAELVEEIKTFLLDSKDDYFNATRSIYDWCGESTTLLEAYMELLNNTDYDGERLDTEKTILSLILAERITRMNEAVKMLSKSSMIFIEISRKIETLENLLKTNQKAREFHLEWQTKIDQVKVTIGQTIDELTNEIKIIADANSKTENIHRMIPGSHSIRATFVDTVNSLTDHCHEYRVRHGDKK